jgi:hypothetical protein
LLLCAGLAALLLARVAAGEPTLEQLKLIEVRLNYLLEKRPEPPTERMGGLLQLEPDAIPYVRKALEASADPEIKLCCKIVIACLEAKLNQRTRPPGPVNTDASRVTVALQDARLAEILYRLHEQSGNTPMSVPRDWQDQPITFEVRDCPYWEAVQKLCALTGLYCRRDRHYHAGCGVGLEKIEHRNPPEVVSGPVMVRYLGTYLSRPFRPPTMSGWLSMRFDYVWEDRLPAGKVEASVREIVTREGRRIAVKPKWLKPHDATRGLSGFTLDVEDFPCESAGIAELRGTIVLKLPAEEGGDRSCDFVFRDLPIR